MQSGSPDQGWVRRVVRLGVTNSRLSTSRNKLTPLRSEGVVRQGNRQAGRQLAAAWKQTVRGQVWLYRVENTIFVEMEF